MDEKIKDQEVLLVKDQKDKNLKAVSGTDEKGGLKTVPPTAEHEQSFLKFDKHSNALENFLSNFMRQFKHPTPLNFFKVPFESAVASARVLSEMLKAPEVPSNKEMLDSARVNPSDYAGEQKQSFQGIDPDKVKWEQFEQMGISRESLEKGKHLDDLLQYRKSPLIPISIKIGEVSLYTDARLSLKASGDGTFIPVVHAIRKKPQLEREFFGHTFTDEDKKALRETGNLGRTVELTFPNSDKPTRSFVSIDRLTNDIIALSADKVRIPDEIKGVKLSEEQKKELSEGKSIYVEGMTAKTGKSFNANLQFNADKRAIEFRFGSPKQSQGQQQESRKAENQEKRQGVRIPKKLLGREVSQEEQAKLKEGGTVYMEGLKDKQGQPFNAYVRANFEKDKFDFFKWNPDKSQAKEVVPDNASQTQVAVNSEGKTNEATKHIKEPLKEGQTQPTAEQKEEKQEQKRSKGMKM